MIVGLGNPGEKYKLCRHNVGFMLVDALAKSLGLEWESNSKLKSEICKKDDLVLIKPQEFMNNSGVPVSLVANFYKIDTKDITVIHDDVDLPFAEIKKQIGSGAAGHHGVESIITSLGTKDFWRVRVGIGRPTSFQPVDEFVLSDFTGEELERVRGMEIIGK